jgi:hypothetical protein
LIWPQIISQCNIYEAGDKKKVFMYMPEQVISYTGFYKSISLSMRFVSLTYTAYVIDIGGRQGPEFRWAHPV